MLLGAEISVTPLAGAKTESARDGATLKSSAVEAPQLRSAAHRTGPISIIEETQASTPFLEVKFLAWEELQVHVAQMSILLGTEISVSLSFGDH